VIVALLLSAAAAARHAVRGRALRWPGRALLAEVTIAAAVLGITSLLISTSPPSGSDDRVTQASSDLQRSR
jgi:putative copper export protein